MYDRKNALIAADDLLRILTDRGTEYCGQESITSTSFIFLLKILIIQKPRQKVLRQMGFVNVSTAQFRMSFYAIAFEKKMYDSLEDMQKDIDQWLLYYNNERAHSSRYCFGKTPVQTFTDSKSMAQQKDLTNLLL